MSLRDIADLGAHWRNYPPAHIALRRLEQVFAAVHGIDPGALNAPSTPPRPRSFLMTDNDFRAFRASN
jgi:hypothetical protein